MATRILTLYSTTIGKKAVMAVSGLVLIGFLIGHLSGNLLVFSEHGHQAINDYSHWLREFGHGVVIWIVRAGLLAAALAHIWSAMSLTAHNRAARPVRYQRKQDLAATLSSKTMAYGGIALFLYFIYHLAHLTFGVTVPATADQLKLVTGEYTPLPEGVRLLIETDVYTSIVSSFQEPAIAGVYILAQIF
ncbi:MAG: succinate dehydrogenase cytochrome b subunit, partial [Myxococcales bacterium]|nr:succinate dehydrogenase cytochrome b subunit [Myxococcales bacterium]